MEPGEPTGRICPLCYGLEATKTLLEVMTTGGASSICFHPAAVSLLKVIEPGSVPVLFQRLPNDAARVAINTALLTELFASPPAPFHSVKIKLLIHAWCQALSAAQIYVSGQESGGGDAGL